MSAQLLKVLPILGKFRENLLHAFYEVGFICKRHLVAHFWIDDVAGSAEVRNHRYGSSCERFKDHACTEVANRRKHHDIR